MSIVLYYSNHCGHCKNILLKLSKSSLKSDIHFLCIDKRFKIDDKTYLMLENGEKILLPNTITKVPAIMLLSKNNETLFGKAIHKHFDVLINNTKQIVDSRQQTMEPQSYDLSSVAGVIKSDNYSFVDMSPEELGAKGNGGTRMMYNYASLNGVEKIYTPEENYKPNKVDESEIKKYTEERATIH
jgi:hypothetical protein